MIRTILATLAVIGAMVLTACSTVQNDPSLEVDNIVSKGVIDNFGSIFVNGIEFKTAGATLHLRDDKTDKVLDSEAQVQDFLKKGMVVTVKGQVNKAGTIGTAQEVEFRNTMQAKIDDNGVDLANSTITVLGQKVVVDDSIRSLLLDGTVKAGDVIVLSGLPDDKGQIKATFLEKKAGVTEFEAKGFVKLIPGSSSSFTLLLSPGAATGITVNVAAGTALPADGSFIEVKTGITASGGTITAVSLESEDEIKPSENQKVSIEGFITTLVAPDDFIVNGQQVHATAATVFVGGIKSDLTVGMKVETEGSLVGGVINATWIVFQDNISIDAIAGAVSAATATTQASVNLLGINVIITSSTDLRGLGSTTLDLAKAAGQELLIRGSLAANGDIIATRVDLVDTAPDPAKFRPFLRGPVTAKDAVLGTLTIAGITVKTGTRFVDNKKPVPTTFTQAAFFNAITVNATTVRVTWDAPFSATSAAVREAELET